MLFHALYIILGFVLVGDYMPAQTEATMLWIKLINAAIVGGHSYALYVNAAESTFVSRWPVTIMAILIMAIAFADGIIDDSKTGYVVSANDVLFAIVTASILFLVFVALRGKLPKQYYAN